VIEEPHPDTGGTRPHLLHRLEDLLALTVLAVMTIFPLVEVVGREILTSGIPGSISIVLQMTLWITFLGAALAARSDRLLALATDTFLPPPWRSRVRLTTSFVAVVITALLCMASLDLMRVDFRFGDRAAWSIPVWVFTAVMPLSFALMVLRLVRHAADDWRRRLVPAAGIPAAAALVWLPGIDPQAMVLPLGAVILVATAFGMPIFAAIGGAALLLFWGEGTPISAVPGEAYRMSTSPMLPAIPLFTFAGYILATGGASQRLLRLSTALVGWMPGGLAIVVTLVLAFFTPLTGASGVTILAMGGLLLPMLVKGHYADRSSVGLVTVSGSIGVLFPPSLPVILYAYYAELDLDQLFIAGIVPGIILVLAVAAWGAWRGVASGAQRSPFSARELGRALWSAKWEVLLPVVILTGIFGGFATLVEASAITVLYALIVECLVCRELDWRRDIARVAIESTTLIGGFMIILGVALGLTNYLIIAQVPMHTLEWVQAYIQSPYVFLLTLNLLLIVVGALMDIYSAIIVCVPLIVPMAAAYGINPVHLGIIFLVNMQLGYLMPPMGENLFLSAYRFDRSLVSIYRSTLPYVAIILVVVLLITYLPGLSLWLPEAVGAADGR
jgi:C4-dicarboxylate transporter DctM subunit